MREKKLLLRSLTLLLPLFGAGLLHCTFSGLDSLGAGGSDGGAGDDSSSIVSVPDTGVDTGAHPQTDSGGQPPTDSGQPPVVDSGADTGEDAGETVPPAAIPIFVDAGASTWCTQHPQYMPNCEDFDEKPLPDSFFTTSDGDFLAQTSSLPSSGPNDLLMYVPPQPGGPWGSKLRRDFNPTQAVSIVLAFDFYPELVLSNSGMLFAGLDFQQAIAAPKYSLRLAYNNGAPRLEESYLSSTPDRYHSNISLPLRTWSRIQVEITFPPYSSSSADAGATPDAGVAATESIYVNGVLQGVPESLEPPAGFDHEPTLLLGAVYGGSSTTASWAFRYDNVTIDIQ